MSQRREVADHEDLLGIAWRELHTGHWARVDGAPCVAKRAGCADHVEESATREELKRAAKRAAEYLETEAEVQRLSSASLLFPPTHSLGPTIQK